MNPQAEAELKQLVDRELRVYDKFVQTIVDVLVNLASNYPQKKINNFILNELAERLCKYLRRSESTGTPEFHQWHDKIAHALCKHLRYWTFFREEDTEELAGWGDQFRSNAD